MASDDGADAGPSSAQSAPTDDEAYADYLLRVVLCDVEPWSDHQQRRSTGVPRWANNHILSPAAVPLWRLDGNEAFARRALDYLAENADALREREPDAWRVFTCLPYCGTGLAPYAIELIPYVRPPGSEPANGERYGSLPFVAAALDKQGHIFPQSRREPNNGWLSQSCVATLALIRAGDEGGVAVPAVRAILQDRSLDRVLQSTVRNIGIFPKTPLDFSSMTLKELLLVYLGKFEPGAAEPAEYVRAKVAEVLIRRSEPSEVTLFLLGASPPDATWLLPRLTESYTEFQLSEFEQLITRACQTPEDLELLRQGLEELRNPRSSSANDRNEAGYLVTQTVRTFERRQKPYANDPAEVERLLAYGSHQDVWFHEVAVEELAELINEGHPLAAAARAGLLEHLQAIDEPSRVQFALEAINRLNEPFVEGIEAMIMAWRWSEWELHDDGLARIAMAFARMGEPGANSLAAIRGGAPVRMGPLLYAHYRLLGETDPETVRLARSCMRQNIAAFPREFAELILVGQDSSFKEEFLSNTARDDSADMAWQLTDRRAKEEAGAHPARRLLESLYFEDLFDPDYIDSELHWDRLVAQAGGNKQLAVQVLVEWADDDAAVYGRGSIDGLSILQTAALSDAHALLAYLRVHAAEQTRRMRQALGADSLRDIADQRRNEFFLYYFTAYPTEFPLDSLPDAAEVVPLLVGRLQELRGEIRRAEQVREQAEAQPFQEAWVRDAPLVRAVREVSMIVACLAWLGRDADEAVPVLTELAHEAPFQELALSALMAIGPGSANDVGGMITEDSPRWAQDAITLFAVESTSGSLSPVAKALAEQVMSPSSTKAQEAAEKLAKIGPAGVARLLELAAEAPPNRSRLLIEVLSKVKTDAAAAALVQLARRDDQPLELRRAILNSIIMGTPRLNPEAIAALDAMARHEDENISYLSARILSRQERRAVPAIPGLVAYLSRYGESKIIWSIQNNQNVEWRGAEIPALDSLTRYTSGDVAVGIVRALRQLGAEAKPALPVLVDVAEAAVAATNDSDSWPRFSNADRMIPERQVALQELFWAIHNIGPNAESVPRLLEMLPDERFQWFAAHALDGVRMNENLQPAMDDLRGRLSHSQELVRGYAALLTVGLPQADNPLNDRVQEMLGDPSEFVASAAAYSLGARRVTDSLPDLRNLLERATSESLKTVVQEAIQQIESPGGLD